MLKEVQMEQNEIISKIRQEFDLVKTAYTRLKEEKDVLASEKQGLMNKVEEQDIIIKELKQRNENLQLAKAVKSEDPESNSLAQERINGLVSEIDKCIALLNR